ncbi:MAG: hypothetical protein IMZ66_08915 [Planctomycetes bacterium]|nr:hypothetical protein [Planctomycetota bacterium]
MSTDTANLFWGPIEALRTLTASSASFQDLVGATGDAEAKLAAASARVYSPGIVGPAPTIRAARPFVIVDQGTQRSLRKVGSDQWESGGTLFWHLEADVPSAQAGDTTALIAAAHKWFVKLAGDILAEMLSLVPGGGYLSVADVSLLYGPWRPLIEDNKAGEGDHYQIGLEIGWGPSP